MPETDSANQDMTEKLQKQMQNIQKQNQKQEAKIILVLRIPANLQKMAKQVEEKPHNQIQLKV